MNGIKLLSIKEFSAFSGLEQPTLRYWDKIGILCPVQRDPKTNYRYYLPSQIIVVNFIKVMKSLDVPLQIIGEMKKERTPKSMLTLLGQQETLLNTKMQNLREAYSAIHTYRDMLSYGFDVNDTQISVVRLKEKSIILGPRTKFVDSNQFFYEPFMQFCKQAKALQINLNYPIGGYWQTFSHFSKSPSQPNNFFSLDPHGSGERMAGDYLEAFVRGDYGYVGDLPQRVASYAQENNLKFAGPVWITYVNDEISTHDPSRYLARLIILVKTKH